jgi:hypothetical protein
MFVESVQQAAQTSMVSMHALLNAGVMMTWSGTDME